MEDRKRSARVCAAVTRKILFTVTPLSLIFLLAGDAGAQKIELTAFGGYRIGGAFNASSGSEAAAMVNELQIKDDFNFGGIFGVGLSKTLMFEVLYDRQNTEIQRNNSESNIEETIFLTSVDYYHFGLVFHKESTTLQPFFGLTFGATRFGPEKEYEGSYRGSGGIIGGIKIFVNEYLGFRGHGRWVSTFLPSTDDIFCDVSGNCYRLPESAYMNQINISAGIFVAF